MIDRILRSLVFLQTITVSLVNFGLRGTIMAHFVYRSRNAHQPVGIWLRPLGRFFYFRGKCDRGVLSHFYKPGYRICPQTGTDDIRYIIDAGANIGDETLRFRHFHPQAKIYALEVEVGNFQLLKLNTAGDERIVALQKALWSHNCQLHLLEGGGNEGFQVGQGDGATTAASVEAVSISWLLEHFQIPRIDILKLDIEGAERSVFGGKVQAWMKLVRVLIFEPPDHEAPGTTQLIFSRLQEAGGEFRAFLHGENIVLIRSDVDWRLVTDLFLRK